MKRFLSIIVCASLLQSCSWICRFFVVNTFDQPLSVEIKLKENPGSFPIFHEREFYFHTVDGKKLSVDTKEFLADTVEDHSHIKFTLPAHTAVEIGRLLNDNYEKHDQYFINGRIFNLEKLTVSGNGKEITVIPENFDSYFSKGKYKELYYWIR